MNETHSWLVRKQYSDEYRDRQELHTLHRLVHAWEDKTIDFASDFFSVGWGIKEGLLQTDFEVDPYEYYEQDLKIGDLYLDWSEFGKKPCPNCGGDDRFWINNYNGILYHHCRQRCDLVEREKAMQRDGLLLTDYNANQIPYHVTKQIPLLGKAYLDGDNVIIPLMGVSSGEKRGTQTIKPNSSKLFSKGMIKEGCGCFIGENSNILYVCEGWATAVAVHMATGEQVLFALDAKTLVKTVRRLQHPRIIIAGDNDPEGVKAASKANF